MSLGFQLLALSSVICLLTLAFTSTSPAPASLKSNKASVYEGFEFIGQQRKKTATRSRAKPGPEPRQGGPDMVSTSAEPPNLWVTKYYVSSHKAKWAEAVETCKNVTKCHGHLVRIQDAEEDKAVQSYIPASKYNEYLWTDGVSDSEGKWAWSGEDGQKMKYVREGFSSQSQPQQPGAHLAIAIKSTGSGFEWSARTDPQEQNYFICQAIGDDGLGLEATAIVPCDEQTNLAIVLDHTTNISGTDLGRVNEFATKLASGFPSPSRVFFFGYEDISQPEAEPPETKVEPVTPTPEGRAYVTRISPPRGAADLGITKLAEISTHRLLSRMVVLTNGKAKIENLATKQAARARQEHITVFTIGIGPAVDSKELLTLADQKQGNVFMLPDFESLDSKLGQISRLICQPST